MLVNRTVDSTAEQGAIDSVHHLLALVSGNQMARATLEIKDPVKRTESCIKLTLEDMQRSIDSMNVSQIERINRDNRKLSALNSLKKLAVLVPEVEW